MPFLTSQPVAGTLVRTLSTIVALSVALTACGGSDEAEDPTSTTQTEATDAPSSTTDPSDEQSVDAAPGTIVCNGLELTLDISPGVSATPADQDVTGSGSLADCTAGDPDGASGAELTFSGEAQDLAAELPPPGTALISMGATIAWDDGTTSEAGLDIVGIEGASDGVPIGAEITVTTGPYSEGEGVLVPLSIVDIVPGEAAGSMVSQSFAGADVTLGG